MTDHDTLPDEGYVRLKTLIPHIIPVSKSTWWEGVRTGRFPQAVKLGPRTTAWRVEDIRALIRNGIPAQDTGPVGPASVDENAATRHQGITK